MRGLGNAFLSHIAAVDGIFHCIRAFDNVDVVHVVESVDPIRDLDIIQSELCKKDLEFVSKAEADELKDVKKNPTMKLSVVFYSTYQKVKELLEANKPIRDGDWTTTEIEFIKVRGLPLHFRD